MTSTCLLLKPSGPTVWRTASSVFQTNAWRHLASLDLESRGWITGCTEILGLWYFHRIQGRVSFLQVRMLTWQQPQREMIDHRWTSLPKFCVSYTKVLYIYIYTCFLHVYLLSTFKFGGMDLVPYPQFSWLQLQPMVLWSKCSKDRNPSDSSNCVCVERRVVISSALRLSIFS